MCEVPLKPQTIRLMDVWLGRICCFLLTLLRRICVALSGDVLTSHPISKILFLKLIEQGATVLAAGAIQRAVDMVGRENVYFCVFAENREILDVLNMIPKGNVFTLRHHNFFVFVRDVFSLLGKVRRLKIDAVIDMEFFSRASAIIAFLTGAEKRVGFHRFTSEAPYRGDLMTHRIQYNPYIHTAIAYGLLVDALEADSTEIPLLKRKRDTIDFHLPVFIPGDDELRRVRSMLREAFGGGEVNGRIVILNPNASDMLPIRRWPEARFVELAGMILDKFPDVQIILTGSPSEEKSIAELQRKISSRRVASLAGKTTLRDLIVLYTFGRVLVTNDSGPAHFASLTPIHRVILYGPETPLLFGALGENSHVVYANFACSPCVNVFNHRFSPCKESRCMEAITTEEVFSVVVKCLEGQCGI